MADTVQRKGRGCFFYGAITFVLVLVGVMLGLYFGARKAANAAVLKYTATSPTPIPRLNLSPADEERIARDLAQNAQRAATTQGGQIVLNEQDINVLLGQSPEVRPFRQQIYVQPEGDKLKAQMSLPLDQFEYWKSFAWKIGAGDLTNRFLNGTAFLDLSVTNGALKLAITNLVVNGETLPEQFTKRLKDQNFAQGATNNPALQSALQRVQDVAVKDGRIVIQFRQ
ncbi:MAG TPA: hypothetical protein VM735_10395 [Candidatus Kapabacteria bacterium]|nr:hypothetical protein [Candidatus Kapabacteria bacterium]